MIDFIDFIDFPLSAPLPLPRAARVLQRSLGHDDGHVPAEESGLPLNLHQQRVRDGWTVHTILLFS
jgi:hypothetical protein